MYTHIVIIIRPDTTNDFYYNVNGTLNDPVYISLANQAKADGRIISEEMTISSDGLTLERKVIWDSEQSFTDFLNQWLIHNPNYRAELQEYSGSVGHHAMLIA
jgi:hypothetical protein